MAEYRTEAVVLRSRPYGEGHRLLTLYSADRGKYTVIAKGVEKPRSSLAAGCQLFTHSEFLCWEGKSLDGVRQAQPVHSFRQLREELERMAAASYTAELVDNLVQPEDADRSLFGFLLAAFTLLAESSDLEIGVRYIEWQLLDRLGFMPLLERCLECGRELGEGDFTWRLSPREGGLVCGRCAGSVSGPELSAGAVRTLQKLVRLHPSRLHVLNTSNELRRQLAGVGENYLEYILERPLRSRDFMEGLFESSEPE